MFIANTNIWIQIRHSYIPFTGQLLGVYIGDLHKKNSLFNRPSCIYAISRLSFYLSFRLEAYNTVGYIWFLETLLLTHSVCHRYIHMSWHKNTWHGKLVCFHLSRWITQDCTVWTKGLNLLLHPFPFRLFTTHALRFIFPGKITLQPPPLSREICDNPRLSPSVGCINQCRKDHDDTAVWLDPCKNSEPTYILVHTIFTTHLSLTFLAWCWRMVKDIYSSPISYIM